MIPKRAHPLMGGIEGRFDGHAHVFRADLPMATPRRYTPDYNAEMSDFAVLLRANGLDGALLVQPSFLGTDNSFLLKALYNALSIPDLAFRGVVVLGPETSRARIDELTRAGVTGMRLNLVGGAAKNFDIDAWDGLLRRINIAGWHVELHCEGALLPPVLDALLCRSATIVIDHFGLPDRDSPLDCPGHRAILAAPRGQVFVKISAPYRVFPNARSEGAARSCDAIFRSLQSHLGSTQLIWGSDWPWTQFGGRHDYAQSVNWFRRWSKERS